MGKKNDFSKMKVVCRYNGVEYTPEELPEEARQQITNKHSQATNDELNKTLHKFPANIRLNCYYAITRAIKEQGEFRLFSAIEAASTIKEKISDPSFDYDIYLLECLTFQISDKSFSFFEPIEEIKVEKSNRKKHLVCRLYGYPYYYWNYEDDILITKK